MWKTLPIIAGLVLVGSLNACKPTATADTAPAESAAQAEPAAAPETFKVVDAAAFDQALRETPDAVLLDVRTPGEFAGGFIPGAQLMDYNDPSFADKLATLDKGKPYFVYCAAGVRSHGAYEMMKAQGFRQVIELEGGISAWESADLPLAPATPQ
jgi:rhodanese-related sulfurtransferase